MPSYSLNGVAPRVHPTAWVAPTAVLIGDVEIGPRASVWWGAVVRGDNALIRVGEESNIQDGAVLHADPGFPLEVGRRVTVGHRATLHGCKIHDSTLVGIGATVLNGAELGPCAMLGAHALVPERRQISAGQLALGSPAKPVKSLSDVQRQLIELSAASYVERIDRYRSALLEVKGG